MTKFEVSQNLPAHLRVYTPYEQEAHLLANQIEEARAAFAAGFELLEETGRIKDQVELDYAKKRIEMLIFHMLEQK